MKKITHKPVNRCKVEWGKRYGTVLNLTGCWDNTAVYIKGRYVCVLFPCVCCDCLSKLVHALHMSY
jgi:hypothetical protein